MIPHSGKRFLLKRKINVPFFKKRKFAVFDTCMQRGAAGKSSKGRYGVSAEDISGKKSGKK